MRMTRMTTSNEDDGDPREGKHLETKINSVSAEYWAKGKRLADFRAVVIALALEASCISATCKFQMTSKVFAMLYLIPEKFRAREMILVLWAFK